MPVGIYTRTKYHRNLMKKVGKSSKGKSPWNKNKKGIYSTKTIKRMSIAQIVRFQDPKERKKNSEAQKIAQNRSEVKAKTSGKNHYTWNRKIGWRDGETILDIHNWLRKIYGKANRCENLKCKKKSNIYEWSLLKECKYERKRENFWMLCASCHHIYDDKAKNLMSCRNRPWNKNLTKYTDERIRKYGLKSGRNRKDKGHVPKTAWKKENIPWNKNLTKETDERLKKVGEKISKTKQKYV